MKLKKLVIAHVLALGVAVLTGCATPAIHPGLKNGAVKAEMIPVRDFVASRASNSYYSVSPDGKKLAWQAVKGLTMHFFIKDLETGQTSTLSVGNYDGGYTWELDSRHLILRFNQGGENGILGRLDTAAEVNGPRLKWITPEGDVKAALVSLLADDLDHILVAHNQRDKSVFDLYRVDLNTGEQTRVVENPGNVAGWITDTRGQPAGRIVKQADESAFILDGRNEPVYRWSADDFVQFVSLSEQGDRLYLLSNKGRDRTALLAIDIASGAESILYEDARVDVSAVIRHPISGKPLRVHIDPDFPESVQLGSALPEDFGLPKGRADVRIVSTDRALQKLVLLRITDKGAAHYFYDMATRQVQQLGTSPSLAFEHVLADVQPITFNSRDGIPLQAYLTLPAHAGGKLLPMVLLVHGGPWARDTWHYNPEVQFLANRGYAVLQVNFRGSKGYGRRFQELAIGEFAGKMQDDLLDAVQWAVAQGIADPDRMAISGASYGGYAALVGLTATPETFACGIDMAGPTDLARLVEDFPKYWKLEMRDWHRYAGDPSREADRQTLRAKSPLFQTERLVRPLMVVQGEQDIRVRPDQSLELVKRLRELNKPVDFWLIPNAGHGVGYWPQKLKLYRKTEDFLARCLGGRSGGLDFYELGAWLF